MRISHGFWAFLEMGVNENQAIQKLNNDIKTSFLIL